MNHHTSREVAKFLAGIACHETLGHLWLGTLGRDLLPLSFSLFTFTEDMNLVCMVVWPVILAGLVWYAWLWHPRAESVTA
jgi:hypothetical protein